MKKESIVSTDQFEHRIYVVRGQRVMLDQDLAVLYGVTNKRLNEQVRRNVDRFPQDFSFYMIKSEWDFLRSQFATLNGISVRRQGQHSKYLPRVFTEHGALMLASVLHSERAIKMSIEVINAFIRMRKLLASHELLTKDVQELKSFALKHSHKTDQEFHRVWRAIEKLSAPIPPPSDDRRIGFRLD